MFCVRVFAFYFIYFGAGGRFLGKLKNGFSKVLVFHFSYCLSHPRSCIIYLFWRRWVEISCMLWDLLYDGDYSRSRFKIVLFLRFAFLSPDFIQCLDSRLCSSTPFTSSLFTLEKASNGWGFPGPCSCLSRQEELGPAATENITLDSLILFEKLGFLFYLICSVGLNCMSSLSPCVFVLFTFHPFFQNALALLSRFSFVVFCKLWRKRGNEESSHSIQSFFVFFIYFCACACTVVFVCYREKQMKPENNTNKQKINKKYWSQKTANSHYNKK